MKNGTDPNPDKVFPVPGSDTVVHVKPTIKNPNIIVGDFTYFSEVDFESRGIDEINQLIPLLSDSNLDRVKEMLKQRG